MFGISRYVAAGAAIALTLSLAWGLRVDQLRDGWRTRYITETGEVTALIRRVTNNPKLEWKDAPKQIELIADSREVWKNTAGEQTVTIDRIGAEAERLRGLNADLRVMAETLIKQREKLIDRLENSAKNPGDRADCQAQIAAVEAALDAVYAEDY